MRYGGHASFRVRNSCRNLRVCQLKYELAQVADQVLTDSCVDAHQLPVAGINKLNKEDPVLVLTPYTFFFAYHHDAGGERIHNRDSDVWVSCAGMFTVIRPKH